MRLKFGQRQNDWKCCFCCHVRTGTIFLGIWHLMLHVLALSVIAVVMRHPEMVQENVAIDPVLPTPLSEVDDTLVEMIAPNLGRNIEVSLHPQGEVLKQTDFAAAHGYRDIFVHRSLNHQDLNVGMVVTFCTFAITLIMVYGAIKGKPSYLMPFFCLQVFDFCIASLTAVGYLCYLPDVHRVVEENPHLPFQEELLRLNPQCLSLLVLMFFMLAMMVKAYFIGVVWSCYKYLTLRLAATQRTIHYIDPDSQSLLPDLPDYETAMCDPRFAVKKFPTPPPSYSAAVEVPMSMCTEPAPVPVPPPVTTPYNPSVVPPPAPVAILPVEPPTTTTTATPPTQSPQSAPSQPAATATTAEQSRPSA
ncbi:lysosomal-associated transmembrane protein 4A [Schistocerca nitens]|uniref:lysosomal-associated transmembrane protein 4A n=1 Tax=Schistocerca nitens TaxID=7011 RepID=UPI00211973D9|nr:lysosomal-associated transmembrane protein 4A [Schistocerca nitens]XP_049792751.1 lysosomal-associated transmembrane protein 4A [Schistocerca nitens]XP_049792752.1 lysosomal-associated transmembrane protein 4A [Schistocerca nitens]XP_049792753.1 lysosomal-associated transmembrane protein 4A [Schistocerca nitens]